jgi:starch phosphorylase
MLDERRDVDFMNYPETIEPSSSNSDAAGMMDCIAQQMRLQFAKSVEEADRDELFRAAAMAIRPWLVGGMMRSAERLRNAGGKSVYYLSMEFLLGRSLSNNLQHLGLYETMQHALAGFGLELSDILEAEPDAALGNGGLGRLAACFLDSLATLHMPGFGYGINYEFGLFRQVIRDGRQQELPDYWASHHSPWLIQRDDQACVVPVYGQVEERRDRSGQHSPMWLGWQTLVGVPHDLPIVGHDGRTVNFLRLFSARASSEFDIQIFNDGDYLKAVEQKIHSEAVSKVLYPSDAVAAGKELRLVQEYFLVACALRDIFRRFASEHSDVLEFADYAAIQMNDTHPALAVAELMRTLVDEHDVAWDVAWEITQACCGYTNHTLMPEALEKWPIELFSRVLPRHLQIVYEINRRFLAGVAQRWPSDTGRLQRMSLIDEGPPRMVRMANLAIVGSHAVNGVAKLHSQLVQSELVPDFHEYYPGKFGNKTNGVTPRRWLMHANPALSSWISDRIGQGWRDHLDGLRALEPFADDPPSQESFLAVKQANKQRLARTIRARTGAVVDPHSLFDVQVKRMHEYKRQLLHVMAIMDEYFSIVEDGQELLAPRTHVIAGKAAPGYFMAKLIIKLINNLALVVNHDPRVGDQMKVVFLPDYKVSLAEIIIPGADLSEQISTAGTEASGTGNMKFALNGALTIGTLDGANVEIEEEVGQHNIFIFGMETEDVQQIRARGYDPWKYYRENPRLRRVVDNLVGSRFGLDEPSIFEPIRKALLDDGDFYLHLADFLPYVEAQREVSRLFLDRQLWSSKAILNVARMGKFSSDRTIQQYADEIWGIHPVRPY